MGRERLSAGPVEALRKKEKNKARKKCAAQRAEQHETSLVQRSENDVSKTLGELRTKNARDTIGHRDKGKLERMEKLLKKHGEKLEERWQKLSVLKEKKTQQHRVDTMAEVAVYSVYYDRDTNPFGVPPPGKPASFRHPDGSTQPHPPFQVGDSLPPPPKRQRASDESDSSSSEDAPQPSCPPPPQVLPPGFSFNPLTKFQQDANRVHSENERARASIPYRPPLPQTPPPIKNKPPPPREPPPMHLLQRSRLSREATKPSFDDFIAMAKRQADAEAQESVRAVEGSRPGDDVRIGMEVMTTKPVVKTTNFVPTVLRTTQARVDHSGDQVSALSLAVGSENVRSKKPKDKKEKESKDLDAAFDSFMKEV